MAFFRRKLGPLLDAAGHAGETGNWTDAADKYRAILRRVPGRADIRIQLGHSLGELGRTAEAEAAYRQASDDDCHNPDAPFHLGRTLLDRGETMAALDALSEALRRDPGHRDAVEMLRANGMLLQLAPELRGRVRKRLADELSETRDVLARRQQQLDAISSIPFSDYAQFRPAMTLPPPASTSVDAVAPGRVHFVIDAMEHAPAYLRMTLVSLLESTSPEWTATIWANDSCATHPVASLAELDARLSFFPHAREHANAGQAIVTAYLTAGTALDRETVAWLAWTFRETAAVALVCDWDWASHSWDRSSRYCNPTLLGIADPDVLAALPVPPPLVALRGSAADQARGPEERRDLIVEMTMSGAAVAHIPLPLAAICGLAERARIAPDGDVPTPCWSQYPLSAQRADSAIAKRKWEGGLSLIPREGRPPLATGTGDDGAVEADIRIIIPTRDCASELEIAVDSLIASACLPERLAFTIIDNRSQEPATRSLLAALQARSGFEVLHDDSPFNWSKINNVGAAHGAEPILVLANNDIRMLSFGWDSRLRAQLARPDVGIVGARLLYPDGAIQHAGMIFGFGEGPPMHDGVSVELDAPEQDPRFDRCRACSAVTGAFLAIARKTFDAVGGLDAERFIIAYNDVDLCLAVRAIGLKVLYDPGVELMHYESRTRGLNNNRRMVAWDQEELRSLHCKWGRALFDEPGLSPWWSREAAHVAFRQLTPQDIAQSVLASISKRWKPSK